MKQYVYAVFFDGSFWEAYTSKSNAVRESKHMKKMFPKIKVCVRKVAVPQQW